MKQQRNDCKTGTTRATTSPPEDKPPMIVDVEAWQICAAESVKKRGTGPTGGKHSKPKGSPVFLDFHSRPSQPVLFIKLLHVWVYCTVGTCYRTMWCKMQVFFSRQRTQP